MIKWNDYKPEFLGVLIGILTLNVWYLSSLVIEHRVVPTTYDYFVNAIVVISAAFFGSFSAYHLNDRREQRKQQEIRINSLNSALFVTLRQFNAITQLKRDLSRWEQDSSRFINMPAVVTGDYSDLKLDINSIEFLLRERDPNLLFELSVEQERFEAAIMALNMRNTFHYKELQPALSKAGFNNTTATLEQVIEAVGPKIAVTALKSTDGVFSHVYETYDSLSKVHLKLFETAKEIFPNETFIRFEPQA